MILQVLHEALAVNGTTLTKKTKQIAAGNSDWG
jgi:hypothetical protein